MIADLHYQLAMTYIYASGAGSGGEGGGEGGGEEGAVGLKRKALEHYEKCARVFELLVANAQAEVAAAASASRSAWVGVAVIMGYGKGVEAGPFRGRRR